MLKAEPVHVVPMQVKAPRQIRQPGPDFNPGWHRTRQDRQCVGQQENGRFPPSVYISENMGLTYLPYLANAYRELKYRQGSDEISVSNAIDHEQSVRELYRRSHSVHSLCSERHVVRIAAAMRS